MTYKHISNKTPQWQGPAKTTCFQPHQWVQQAISIQTAARLAQLRTQNGLFGLQRKRSDS